jgi:hypothetical protein
MQWKRGGLLRLNLQKKLKYIIRNQFEYVIYYLVKGRVSLT